jgi:CBS domain-containing protein
MQSALLARRLNAKFVLLLILDFYFSDPAGNMTGIVSERDYIGKIALLGRTSKETLIKEISTKKDNLVTASVDEPVNVCMSKMLTSDIRHLPLLSLDGNVVGMISIKDLVKTVVNEKERTIRVLSDFALGKGGNYGSE